MVTAKHVALVAVVALATSGGCSKRPEEPVVAPFKARYADFSLDVPKRADLYQAMRTDRSVSIRICDRHTYQAGTPPLCEGLTGPVVNAFGLHTFITEPSQSARFEWLKERPQDARALSPAPLVTIPEARIDRTLGDGGEAYELSRIRVLDSNAPLTTTANGWPLARCATHALGNRYCTIGFLIRGAFVEVHLFAEPGASLDQEQIWNVASAIDAKLRALSAAEQ